MAIGKRVVSNVFSNWTNLAVNLVISFFLAPFVVRSLGNAYYGVWVILMQFTGYLYLLDLGVRESVIRYVSKFYATGEHEELSETLNASLVFYIGIGALALVVTAVLAIAFPYFFQIDAPYVATTRIVVVLAGLTIAQTLAFNVYTGVLMGLQRYDLFNKIGIAMAFVRLALIVTFLSYGYGIVALATIQLAVGLATNLLIYYFCRRLLASRQFALRYSHRPLRTRIPVFKSLYNYSVHVVINNIGQKAIYYTDAIVIGFFLGPVSVTFYAIAGNLIEYLRRLMLISNNVLNPLVSDLEAREDSKSIGLVVATGCRLSVLVALPIASVYLIMGRDFIAHWMGAEYAVLSGDVLAVLVIGAVLSTPQNTISNALYGISKHNIIARLRIVEAVFNLALSLWLVQSLGIVGVALGTVIPQIVIMALVLPTLSLPVLGVSWLRFAHESYLLPVLATLPFAACCYLVQHNFPATSLFQLLGQILMMMPIFVVGAWFLGATRDERGFFLGLLKSRRDEPASE